MLFVEHEDQDVERGGEGGETTIDADGYVVIGKEGAAGAGAAAGDLGAGGAWHVEDDAAAAAAAVTAGGEGGSGPGRRVEGFGSGAWGLGDMVAEAEAAGLLVPTADEIEAAAAAAVAAGGPWGAGGGGGGDSESASGGPSRVELLA